MSARGRGDCSRRVRQQQQFQQQQLERSQRLQDGRHLLEPAAAGRVDRADRPAGQRHEARAQAGRQQGRPVHGQLPVARRLDRRGRQVGPEPDARPTRARRRSDPKAVYYIGEFNSGCSEVSIPILNQAGIPQVSPANTYVGLTTNLTRAAHRVSRRSTTRPASAPTCGSFRSTRSRRAADLIAMKQARAARRSPWPTTRRRTARASPRCSSWRRASTASTSPATPGSTRRRRTSARTPRRSRAQGADCFFFAGIVSNGAVQITKDVHAAMPTAKIFGGDGVCTELVHDPGEGRRPGVARSADPVHGRDAGPDRPTRAARTFLAAYKAKYGVSQPGPVRDLRLRGDEARARHDREPRGQRATARPLSSRRCSRSRTARRCSAPTGSTRTATRR